MDEFTRGSQPQTVAPGGRPAAGGGSQPSSSRNNPKVDNGRWQRIGVTAAVAAIVILLIGIVLVISFGSNSNNDEGKYVDTSKLQAVFLNTGQVYFGNITTLNHNYFVLTNIYYLQTANGSSSTSSSSSNTKVSLVKLGCELHQPYDQMVINSTQVTFWENLQPSGQVAKAVATFEKDNPNGQKCSEQTSSASTSSVNSTQNAGNSSSTSGTSSSSNSSTGTNSTTGTSTTGQ